MSDWLDNAVTLTSEVKKAIEKWQKADMKVVEAEIALAQATKEYANVVNDVSELLRQNGIEALRLETGEMLEVVEKIRCSIKKDKVNEVADWLRSRGMDNLVSSQLLVMPSQKSVLDKMGVAYDEKVEMNTNSVKAYVKGELQVGNMEREEIPEGIGWFVYDDIVVK